MKIYISHIFNTGTDKWAEGNTETEHIFTEIVSFLQQKCIGNPSIHEKHYNRKNIIKSY